METTLIDINEQLAPERATRLYNGKYTITSPTGEHRTFWIRTVKNGDLAGKRIVSMLVGPDNQSNYKGFGFVTDTGVNVWYRLQMNEFFVKVAKMLWVMGTTGTDNAYGKAGCEILLSKACSRCNRELTDPTSIRIGIGPICRGGKGEDK